MPKSELLAVAMPLLAALLGVGVVLALGRTPAEPTKDEELHNGGYVRRQIWLQVGAGGVLATGVLAALFSGCAWNFYGTGFCSAVERSPPWALVSGVAAAPALIMLWRWRTVQRAKDQQQRDRELDQHERELIHQDQVAMSSRFADAVKLLSGEYFDRLGGVYALEQVAYDAPQTYRRMVIKTLCTYVRSYKAEGTVELRESSYEVCEAVLAAARVRDGGDEVLDFSGAFLKGADFRGAQLCGALFAAADLTQALFKGADLQRADLSRVKASFALFGEANMEKANLFGADLTRARLYRANLRDATLIEAKLGGATLIATKLEGALLTQADWQGTAFDGATYDDDTYFPDLSFEPVIRGMRKSSRE